MGGYFSKSSKPDYETLLAKLATDINEAKIHLSETRLRERRLRLLVNAYGVALWAVWAGLWWMNGLPWGLIGWNSHDTEPRVIGSAGTLLGPVFIFLLNRLLHVIFARIRTSEEGQLRKLLNEQRKQVDAIKKATNYDSTRKLIEQYDEAAAGTGGALGRPVAGQPQTPQRGAIGASPQAKGPVTPVGSPKVTPRAPGHLVGAGGTPARPMPGTPLQLPPGLSTEQAAAIQMQMQAIQPVLPTPEKHWYDRVVDSILGEDPSQASQTKYALVCGECFRHNGLVGSKQEWERMQWICPRCNHMNPPPISRLGEHGPTESSRQRTKAALASLAQDSPSPSPSPATSSGPKQMKKTVPAASPKSKRGAGTGGDKSAPGSSRLGKEVFSAADSDDENVDDEDDDGMDVDSEK